MLRDYWQVSVGKLESITFGLPADVRARIINPPENFSVTGDRAAALVAAPGGPANVLQVDACMTRLRLSLANPAAVERRG